MTDAVHNQLGEWLTGARVAQPAQGVDEADAVGFDALLLGCRQGHQPDQVIGQGDHAQFLVDAVNRFAAQHIQVERLLQMPQIV